MELEIYSLSHLIYCWGSRCRHPIWLLIPRRPEVICVWLSVLHEESEKGLFPIPMGVLWLYHAQWYFPLCSVFYACILSGFLAEDCSGGKWSLADVSTGELIFLCWLYEVLSFSPRLVWLARLVSLCFWAPGLFLGLKRDPPVCLPPSLTL